MAKKEPMKLVPLDYPPPNRVWYETHSGMWASRKWRPGEKEAYRDANRKWVPSDDRR